LFATALLLVVAVLSNFTPVILMRAVDDYINNGERLAARAGGAAMEDVFARILAADQAGLFRLTLVIAALVLAEALLRYVQILIVSVVGQRTMMEMRIGVFDHLQTMSLRFLDRNPVGRLVSRVTNDVEKIQQTIVTGVVQVVSELFTILVVLIFMVAINWKLALVTVVPIPLVFYSSLLFRKHAQHSFLEVRKKIAQVTAHLQESISGMRVVQLFAREPAVFEEYRVRNADHRDEWLRQVRNFAVYFPVVDFLGTLSTALIIVYTGVVILAQGEEISGVASMGTIYAYVFLAERLFGPIRALADRYNLLLEAMAASERIFQLQDTPPDITDASEALSPAALEGRVEFDGVHFGYEPGQPVLKGVSFAIAPGERVAIVGHTGAGKSTIISLLARFYEVDEGAVRVDGVDVRQYAQAALRRHIGIVLQDVFLFSGSIEENIRLGDRSMPEAHVRACAEHVNAARFIERLPGGYQYDVGERGVNLSTGQRQLLAFARTLAHGPSILVLDEATSSIDTETEGLIQDAIEKLMEGRTSIVIAHRLSTIQHADRILVMHHGEVRESGTHQELLAQGGLYRTLYELQYKDQLVR
jgi:ABC-type multidrug transport system fused ATPase/permease subunit